MSKKDTKKKAPKKAAKKTEKKSEKKPVKKAAAKKSPAKEKPKSKPAKKAAAKPKTTESNGAQQAPQSQGLPYIIHAQYVRDISFENPHAVENMSSGQQVPEMDINIGLDARKIEGTNISNFYEVAINVRAEAKRPQGTVFIAELQYGIAVSVDPSVPEDSHHPLLLIEIPRMAFPYARQILSDVTVQGGYPPLLLNPVDFQALYLQRFGQKQQ